MCICIYNSINSIKSKIQSYFAIIIFEPILEKNDYSKVVEFIYALERLIYC